MRGRLRETVAASAQQAKGIALVGRDLESLSGQLARVRTANSSQIEAVLLLAVSPEAGSGQT